MSTVVVPAMTALQTPTLGILQLSNRRNPVLGSLAHPGTFKFPVVFERLSNVWVADMVSGVGNHELEMCFVVAAKRLASQGVSAITTNCGFAIRFQEEIRRSVKIPIVTSSLLLLPYLLSTREGRVAILTYDGRALTSEILSLSGVYDKSRIVVRGIEGSETWRIMSSQNENYTISQLTEDILSCARAVISDYPDVNTILLECAGFIPVKDIIRENINIYVYDLVSAISIIVNR